MTKLFSVVVVFLFIGVEVNAQCDQNLLLKSSKTEYVNEDTVVERTIDENTSIEINKTQMIISPGTKKMTANILSDTCAWKTPYQEGTSVFNVDFVDEQGNKRNAIVTIQGKNSNLVLMVKAEGMPYMIRVPIDKFEERK
jgi:hypothetical protein